MATLNRILSVLILLLAIGAAAMSFLLFQRRGEFRGRADKLALSVAEMVKSLEKESGVKKSDQISFKPAEAGTPESGTLGWAAYHEAKGTDGTYAAFDTKLTDARKLATDINAQRNQLADQFAQVATHMEFGQGAVDPAEMKNLTDTAKAGKTLEMVVAHAKAVNTRDNAMVKAITTAAATIGHEVNENDLKQRKEVTSEDGVTSLGDFKHQLPLTEFAQNVANVNTRCSDYAKTLGEAISRIAKHNWETDKSKLGNEREYATALTSMMNDYDSLNDKLVLLEKTKVELDETKTKLEETSEDLSQKQKELLATKDKLDDTLAKLDEMIRKFNPDGSAVGKDTPLDENLKGHVLQVNRDWNYVVLDLGQSRIREKVQLLVSRQDKMVAKLEVSKVMQKISIAEVLPGGAQAGEIEPNDLVILSTDEIDKIRNAGSDASDKK